MSASWIHKLNESNSKLHKQDVLTQALEAATLGSDNADTFLKLAGMCYNPYVTFGVRKISDNQESDREYANPYPEFIELLEQLKERKLTGNDAIDAVAKMSLQFSSDEWNNFCAPVIRRDLRAGFSVATINKVCKKTDYEVPVFKCQLATNGDGRPEMSGTKRLEPKLDGVRVLMVVSMEPGMYDHPEPVATCYSRNGKIFENFTHIEDQVTNNVQSIIALLGSKIGNCSKGFVFDGEVVGASFNELMKQARRKTDAKADDTVFHVFDVMPLADFQRGHCNAQFRKRITAMNNLRPLLENLSSVETMSHIIVDLDTDEGKQQIKTYSNDMVNAGFEGIMIKDLEAPYECKRNLFWMKWKPTITVDLQVIDIEEGTGRNKSRLGALVCQGTDDGKLINVNVGSGFSDDQRAEFYSNQFDVIGETVEVLCDAVSQNQDGSYSLRFPRFVRFRDDK
jgi:DNA ligase-1|tara:strand:- start:471 stop:1829 length:1359 start_codon:yes stop_codon:yes gene_type:complete